MASLRRTTTVGLCLGLLCCLSRAQAQNPSSGLTALLVEPASDGLSSDTRTRWRECLAKVLTSAAGSAVEVGVVPSDERSLFDDLRGLPARLATRETLGLPLSRHILVVRVDTVQSGRLRGELVLVDRATPALRGYRSFDVEAGRAPLDIADLAGIFLDDKLPGGPLAAPLIPSAAASTAATSPASAGTVTRPTPLAAPDPGRDSPSERLSSAGSSMIGSVARVRMPTPAMPAATAALVNAYLGTSLAAGTVGQPVSRPRVFEASWQTLLLPAAAAGAAGAAGVDAKAAPVRAVMSVYTTDDSVEVDLRFSRPVKPKLGQDGGWMLCDVPGLLVEAEQTADLGQTGFLTVRARPGDTPGSVRLGCALRTPGDKGRLEARDGGRLVSMVMPKPAPGYDPDGPGGAQPFSLEAGHVVDSLTGGASWYGAECHGGPTASGERFNMYAMTAAHKTLRLGTWVLVTNLRNGKQVVVRINDRGPYVGGRIIDLSYAAADVLGFIGAGVTTVRVDVLDGRP